MDIFGDIIGWTAIVGLVIQFLLKLIPNEKIWNFGFKIGETITTWGSGRFGSAYEKVEEYFQESFGVLFESISYGLDSDELSAGDRSLPPKFSTKKDKVRK
jgi:hypothetical protein